ncbi:MAG: type II secretion system major pseudopilin GspG [Candidatus Omnitrophica bacterium]|nr:type II secretion system major pseudopilin GspG [Candidatus Omnitrophota bacterium]
MVKTHNALRATKHAFTLIELMLVVIIIGALAAMIVPRMAGRSQQAKISIAEADVGANIPTALDMYELDNQTYPSTEQGLGALSSKPSGTPRASNWQGPYLRKTPVDPWGTSYQYRYPSDHQGVDFDLFSYGPDMVESEDDITNWE